MDVIKIIVNEIFKGGCIKCRFVTEVFVREDIFDLYCIATSKHIKDMDALDRPSWCPLEVESEEVCIWTRSENPNWYWKTACGDWFDDRTPSYCSCGNMVEYKDGFE